MTRLSSARDRPLRAIRAVELHVPDVEEQHEQPRVRIRGHLARLGDRVRLAPLRLPGRAGRGLISWNDSMRCGTLSSSTSKSCAVRSVTGAPSVGDVGVDAHEVGAAAKARLLRPRAPARRASAPAAAARTAAGRRATPAPRSERRATTRRRARASCDRGTAPPPSQLTNDPPDHQGNRHQDQRP